ncbi:MAG: hypothetical protein Q9160_007007 [Pyrenula sp. 1 TL-2023]
MPPSRQKTVLITGCSPGGIGHALAIAFHSRGLRVFATLRDSNSDKASELKDLGIECVDLVVDDPESVKACRKEVEELLRKGEGESEDGKGEGRLDYLVNNAGKDVSASGGFRAASELRPSEAVSIIATNVFGPMLVTSTFLPLLLRSKGSAIINIGSLGSCMPLPFLSVYCATKAALYQYSECLRVELAPLGINVTHVQAGPVQSNFYSEKATLDEHGLYAPVKQAFEESRVILPNYGLLASEFARRLVGQILDGRHRDVVWLAEKGFMLKFSLVQVLERWLPIKLWSWLMYHLHEFDKVKKANRDQVVQNQYGISGSFSVTCGSM